MSTAPSGNGSGVWTPPSESGSAPAAAVGALVTERPEVAVGAAFVGGIAVALILRRLGR